MPSPSYASKHSPRHSQPEPKCFKQYYLSRLCAWAIAFASLVGLGTLPLAHAQPAELTAKFVASPPQRFVSAGNAYTCELRPDGTIDCWGNNSFAQTIPPSGSFTQLSTGLFHGCALREDGTAACWGENDDKKATPPEDLFTAVSAGGTFSCGIHADDTIGCWGGNTEGESTPPSGTFTQISAGGTYACGIRTDSTLDCWGNSAMGEPPSGSFTQVSVGGYQVCAIRTDGTVACWGSDFFGVLIPPTDTFSQISVGFVHACGVRTDTTIVCWARPSHGNTYGQLTPPSGSFVQVAAGGNHNCAVRADDTVACWGENLSGQAPPTITPDVLPAGRVGNTYQQHLVGSGGTAPYSFGITEGNPPAGLDFSPSGELSGVPTSSGTYTMSIRAVDANGLTNAANGQSYQLVIGAPLKFSIRLPMIVQTK
jgi:hypothetical protein